MSVSMAVPALFANQTISFLQAVLTDYDDPKLIHFLKKNVETCLHGSLRNRVRVVGHIWGQDTEDILEYVVHPERALSRVGSRTR